MINWLAIAIVALVSIVSAGLVVTLFALGLRLLSSAGRPVHVGPAEFTDAITVVSRQQAETEAKRVRKAAKRSPLTKAQKRMALAGARICFALCVLIVLVGVYLIIPGLHG